MWLEEGWCESAEARETLSKHSHELRLALACLPRSHTSCVFLALVAGQSFALTKLLR